MNLRILAAFLAAICLAGCNQEAGNSVAPPPVTLNSDAMGVFCGMNLLEHPGPKGQIITAGRIDPFWFSSVRDTVAFTLMPDQPRDIRAIYVSDMAQAKSWEDPGATNWVDARKAFFVIESRQQGGMGAAEAVPFGNREAADAFAAANGGRVVTLNSDAMGVFCGMNLLEHPGPKGQIITAGRLDPFWFSSVRDTVAFTLMPDQPRDIRAIYVSDMAQAKSWEDPGATNWVDARKAFFVIESRQQGGMGAAEAVPFANRQAADAFAAGNGGRVLPFKEIPRDYVLGSDAPGEQSQHERPDIRTN